MIKKHYEITVKDFDRIERTGKVSHLKKWYNPFPISLFVKKIEKEIQILSDMLNNNETDNNKLISEQWKVKTTVHIARLRVAYLGILNNLQNRTLLYSISLFYLTFGKRKLKIKPDSNFDFFAEMARRLSGITVETMSDLKRLGKHIELKVDKLNEMIKRTEKKEGEKAYLVSLVIGVCSILQISYDQNITIVEFIEMKRLAEQKINNQQKRKENGRN